MKRFKSFAFLAGQKESKHITAQAIRVWKQNNIQFHACIELNQSERFLQAASFIESILRENWAGSEAHTLEAYTRGVQLSPYWVTRWESIMPAMIEDQKAQWYCTVCKLAS